MNEEQRKKKLAEGIKMELDRRAFLKGVETTGLALAGASLLDKIDILDKYTVRLNYQKPYAFFPVAMNGTTGRAGTMVSRKAVEKYGKALARNPVGTGPFKFVEWVENDHITMVRFPDYFEKGLPYLDRVEVKLMTEASSAVAAIKQQGE